MSGVFMVMTYALSVGYGVLARQVRHLIVHSPATMQALQRAFAGALVAPGAKLALSEP